MGILNKEDLSMQRPLFQFRHVGINTKDAAEAERTALLLCNLFGFDEKKTPVSFFAGDSIEVMNNGDVGRCGHIAFTVSSIADATAYLNQMGWQTNPDTAVHTPEGKIKLVYLTQEIGGFAIHLFEE